MRPRTSPRRVAPEAVGPQVLQRATAAQRHRHLQFVTQQAQHLVRTGLVLDYAGRAFERARPAATQRSGKPTDPLLAKPLELWRRMQQWTREVAARPPPTTVAEADELEAALWIVLGSGMMSGSRFSTMISGLQLSTSVGCQLPGCRFRHCPGNRILLPTDDEVHVVLPHHKTAESTGSFGPSSSP